MICIYLVKKGEQMKSQNSTNSYKTISLSFIIVCFSQFAQAGAASAVKSGLEVLAGTIKSKNLRPSTLQSTTKQAEIMPEIKDYNSLRSKILGSARTGEIRTTKEGGTLSDFDGELRLHYPPNHNLQSVNFLVPTNIDEIAKIAKLNPAQINDLRKASETTIKNSPVNGKQQVFHSFGSADSKLSYRLTWDTNGELASSVLQIPSQALSLYRVSSQGRLFEVSFVKKVNGSQDLIVDQSFHLPEGQLLKQANLKEKNILEIITTDQYNQKRIYEMNLSAPSTNPLRQKSFAKASNSSSTALDQTQRLAAPQYQQKTTLTRAAEVR